MRAHTHRRQPHVFQHHMHVPHGVHTATSGRAVRRNRMLQRARASASQQSIAHLQREIHTLPRRPGISDRVAAVLAEAQAAARATQGYRLLTAAEDNSDAGSDEYSSACGETRGASDDDDLPDVSPITLADESPPQLAGRRSAHLRGGPLPTPLLTADGLQQHQQHLGGSGSGFGGGSRSSRRLSLELEGPPSCAMAVDGAMEGAEDDQDMLVCDVGSGDDLSDTDGPPFKQRKLRALEALLDAEKVRVSGGGSCLWVSRKGPRKRRSNARGGGFEKGGAGSQNPINFAFCFCRSPPMCWRRYSAWLSHRRCASRRSTGCSTALFISA